MVFVHLNDSSLVHSLTPFPSSKEKHRNYVTVLTMTVPQTLMSDANHFTRENFPEPEPQASSIINGVESYLKTFHLGSNS